MENPNWKYEAPRSEQISCRLKLLPESSNQTNGATIFLSSTKAIASASPSDNAILFLRIRLNGERVGGCSFYSSQRRLKSLLNAVACVKTANLAILSRQDGNRSGPSRGRKLVGGEVQSLLDRSSPSRMKRHLVFKGECPDLSIGTPTHFGLSPVNSSRLRRYLRCTLSRQRLQLTC